MPVTHVWNGYGSAIFLEFGELTKTKRLDGSEGQPDGQITLMIEWSWRIEKPRSILGGSFSSTSRWSNMFSKIIDTEVVDIRTIGSIPEIEVSLSNGYRVTSFMTESGQPEWALITREMGLGTLHVKRGKLCVENE